MAAFVQVVAKEPQPGDELTPPITEHIMNMYQACSLLAQHNRPLSGGGGGWGGHEIGEFPITGWGVGWRGSG